MKTNARRAFPAWAMPALVSLLAIAPALPGTAQASERSDPLLTIQASTRHAAAPSAVAAEPARIAEARPPAPARASVPAPRPIPAGPVWSDASGAWRQVGIASWYGGSRWQGRPTASGIRYDERQLTAAHASLPMGSRVRVTVADTGQSVMVTIVDRPGTRRRIIDLSRAAAEQLGIVGRGVAQVTITPG